MSCPFCGDTPCDNPECPYKEPKKIKCWNCSACCRLCDKLEELKHFDRGDGVCINLKEDNTCAIYDTRPEICNTKRMYEKEYKDYISWDQYVELSEIACKYLERKMNEKK